MNIELITNALPVLENPIATPDHEDSLQASAVLMLLHKVDLEWQILFTKRAPHLKSHAGQISFPGGRYEAEDSHLLETAIRETEEEIGLTRQHFQVISQLNEHSTITGYRIFPYVAVIDKLPELTIDPSEVDEVFSAPLHYLIDNNNQQHESAFYQGSSHMFYKIIWQDRLIWGATARMIVDFSQYLNLLK